MSLLKVYIASSFRHLHGVRLLAGELCKAGCEILDWTAKATPPPGLTSAQRRIWMDTDQNGGQVYEFCRNACTNADLVLYFGESGQDAGVEIGMAAASGVPVIGIRGPLESPGLMLHGAVTVWTDDAANAIETVKKLAVSAQNNFASIDGDMDPQTFSLLEIIRTRKNSRQFSRKNFGEQIFH